MEVDVLIPFQPHVALGLVGGEIVEDNMNFAPRIGGDDLVHEIEELDAPAFLVVTADNRAARKIERGEQRRRPVPFVIMARPFGSLR